MFNLKWQWLYFRIWHIASVGDSRAQDIAPLQVLVNFLLHFIALYCTLLHFIALYCALWLQFAPTDLAVAVSLQSD